MDKEELFIPKEKHLGKIIAIIIIFLFLVGSAFGYYKFIYANPLNIANKSLNKIKDFIQSKLNSIDTSNPLEFNGLINIKTEVEEKSDYGDIINDLSIQLNINLIEKEKKLKVNLNSKYKNNKLINLKAYHDKDKLYLQPEDVYDDYLIIKEDDELITKDELISTILKITNAIKEEANKMNWQRKKENDLTKNYLKLENKDAANFVKSYLNTLKKDQQFINQAKKIDSNVENIIDEYINAINNQEKTTYSLAFYTERTPYQNLVKIEQTINEKTIALTLEDDNNIVINVKEYDKELNIKLTLSEKVINILIINQDKESKTSTDLKLNYNNIKDIDDVNIDNAKRTIDLTDEEKKKINESIKEKKEINILYTKIKEIIEKKTNNNTD